MSKRPEDHDLVSQENTLIQQLLSDPNFDEYMSNKKHPDGCLRKPKSLSQQLKMYAYKVLSYKMDTSIAELLIVFYLFDVNIYILQVVTISSEMESDTRLRTWTISCIHQCVTNPLNHKITDQPIVIL